MRNTFVDCLMEQAEQDEEIYVIIADLGFSVFEKFQEKFPDRFLNVGIAEQNAIGVAAGLALMGKKVYVYSIIPFVTMRCFEQIRIDIAYMNSNVKLVGVGAGYSYGPAGTTHHAIEDIAIMRALPNMTVCCPGDPVEAREIVRQSFEHTGPMYIRLGKNGENVIHSSGTKIEIGKAVTVNEGKDLSIITTSNMLEEGVKLVQKYKETGKMAALISMPTIKPLDKEYILKLIDRKVPIITLEEHSIIGGLGSAVAEIIAESGKGVSFRRIGIQDEYSHYIGSQQYLRNKLVEIDTIYY
ncbi:transketolase family protein [Propionispora hippei]|uniref:Transketolase subunit B n=1 Tax=Propionispora hippei DSM 15287 TaxID=1123003 RepID=A0A1M6FHR0_9FIRM|nr:transketolase C-terminal domain-containing protein [Propionispora hippei]SHI97122.1 transketolase subunit B [Propionispora hippei DSM 15287]